MCGVWRGEKKRQEEKKITKRQANSIPHQICVYVHSMHTVHRNKQPLRFLVIDNEMKI